MCVIVCVTACVAAVGESASLHTCHLYACKVHADIILYEHTLLYYMSTPDQFTYSHRPIHIQSSSSSENALPLPRMLSCMSSRMLCFENVLQCVAVCCSVLPLSCISCSANVLRCVAVCCGVLRCVAVCCGVLRWVILYCTGLQWGAAGGSGLQCAAVCCSVLQRVVGTR